MNSTTRPLTHVMPEGANYFAYTLPNTPIWIDVRANALMLEAWDDEARIYRTITNESPSFVSRRFTEAKLKYDIYMAVKE